MDNKMKALIAVGASVASGCEPCLNYHIGRARETGADDRETTIAIEVARAVREGAMKNMDSIISRVMNSDASAKGPVKTGCGCGG